MKPNVTGPFQSFLLLSCEETQFSDYRQFINDPREIRVEFDLILYINDTLKWIPTLNPAKKNESHRGLCLYGPTDIHTEGASVAATIFDAWATLFACGSEILDLTGNWTYIHEVDQPHEGKYERLLVDRDEFVSKLRKVADYARQIVETDGRFFILHMGV